MNQLSLLRPFSRLARPASRESDGLLVLLRERYLGTVFDFARRRLPTSEDAEDATAEAFRAAFSSLHRCPKDEARHRAWLLGITRHKVADLLRKRYQNREVHLELPPDPPDSSPSPEAVLLYQEDLRALRLAVQSLTPHQRDALLFYYTDGLTVREIGDILGKSDAAVNSLLQRARASVFERAAYHFLPTEDLP